MTNDSSRDMAGLSRRNMLSMLPAGVAAAATVSSGPLCAQATNTAATAVASKQPYNILFILVDQQRQFRPGELPVGFTLPAHERLKKAGTTFTNHRINSCVCTPSRSVIYTGQHIQQTRMFDNTNFPWIQSLSTDVPTVGDMLRDAGYYTAYKGKWHLTKEFEEVNKLARQPRSLPRKWRPTASPTISESATSSPTPRADTCTTGSSPR